MTLECSGCGYDLESGSICPDCHDKAVEAAREEGETDSAGESVNVRCEACGDVLARGEIDTVHESDLLCPKCQAQAETNSYEEGYNEAKAQMREQIEALTQMLTGKAPCDLSAADVARHPDLTDTLATYWKAA